MTLSQNFRHHHRAAAAVHRRAPVPEPQLGFDPTAIFGSPDPIPTPTLPPISIPTLEPIPGLPGGTTDVSPSVTSTDDLPVSSSSTTSESSSTTSSDTTSSTTSSPTLLPTSSITTPQATITPPPASRTTITPTEIAVVTGSRTLTTSSIAPSNTSDPDASTGLSTGAVVGGIGAGIVAIAVIGFAVTFFVRRARKREGGNGFDNQDFRRSAAMLPDPPTHEDTVARGFNPRPPTMIENRLASPAPTFGTQYGQPGPAFGYGQEYAGGYSENHPGYGHAGFQSFAPGQVYNMNNGAPSPMNVTSANPMLPSAPYAQSQSPFSPIGGGSPVSEYYPQHYQEHAGIDRQPSAGAVGYPVLTRQSSARSSSDQYHHQPQQYYSAGGSPTQLHRESLPAGDYVDLNRSSVSPYQAAQYAEISRRLNTEVPDGLHTPDIDRELPPVPPKTDASPPMSPFADPSSAPPSPGAGAGGAQYANDRRNMSSSPRPASGESDTLEFPSPPSPVHTASSRYRVDSMPPTLPEIHVESRVSVGNYPGLRNSGAVGGGGLGVGVGASGAAAGPSADSTWFPSTPSPLASSFGMRSAPSTPAEGTFGAHAGVAAPAPAATAATASGSAAAAAAAAHGPARTSMEKKRGTMYSMYDPEDAYGGF